jgi:N-methylhydantoinase B
MTTHAPNAPLQTLVDPISLEVFKNLFASIAEEMGVALVRTSYSPNIKERRDLSCAVFAGAGRLIAQAAHIPVHLGAMPMAVRAALDLVGEDWRPGDVVALNDPYLGGTHLPDITMISPVFDPAERRRGARPVAFVASRAHHADVGGMSAGSMPLSSEIYQEGIIIPPLRIVRGGRPNEECLALIYRNVRTPDERRGDIAAQLAAHRVGERRFTELLRRYGRDVVLAHAGALLAYAERQARAVVAGIPDGTYTFEDVLDDDGVTGQPVRLRVQVRIQGDRMIVDFTGTDQARPGCINAPLAVTQSAVYYVLRCLLGPDVPANAGCFAPIEVIAPRGCVLNPEPPHAVAAGNVETSQRVVDVVLGALAQALPEVIPAASQGTMNNLTAGGFDDRPGRGQPFAYYETMGGGMGASPQGDGLSGVHVHMSNTLNTPIEALEFAYPFRIEQYAIRRGSGGAGRYRGGDGLRRDIRFLVPSTVTILAERRRTRPYGLAGGEPGQPGRNCLIRDGEVIELPGKHTFQARPGDVLSIETPGGGGWGTPHRPAP